MQQHDFKTQIEALELSDAELMQIQGGNIFGDAWNAVKNAVSPTVNAIIHPIDTYHKVGQAIRDFITSIEKASKFPPVGF